MLKQKTIQMDVILEGVGLHMGRHAQCVLKPAAEGAGIRFIRTDLPAKPVIMATPDNILVEEKVPRCTSIGIDGAMVHTVEHLLSVLCGLGITNLDIEIDSDEVPGMDGSGKVFLDKILEAGIKEQDAAAEVFPVIEPVGVEHNGASIYIVPADDFKVSYTLDYHQTFLGAQFYSSQINEDSFIKEIAPCRTFCLESEAAELRAKGLGLGANFENTLVVGKDRVIDNTVRFSDEFARHKVLDFIGDLYLLGVPIRGHVYAVKSGHTLNIQLLKKIHEQRIRVKTARPVPFYDLKGKKEIDIDGIMKILPHRYPFLLVDRVIEIEKGKRAVGIKNVTINDYFFKGHFPTRPVMPGVLMIEAMAQTGGVVVLTNEAHHGKVAFFMAVDKVKFRKVVCPGDQLVMDVEVVRDKSRTAQIRAVSKVNGEVVAEADMVFSYTESAFLHEK